MDLVFLWILLGVVEVREVSGTTLEASCDLSYKFSRIKSEFCSTSSIGVSRIIHFVKLMTIIVVSVHR